ncbi:hypothetical protein CBR_g49184 [Chara braunii]|uniref:Protein kinase domain-containing protein n=1 Tax=Chara braunii TaxID=69332 RepID=A0A388M4I9_CHABU|nr:hypothetical protein CBR_g49184 [Chara braunii]|eukprot:GBG89393.1 hypothetical protein CBR_g49184 [Chara braunii]
MAVFSLPFIDVAVSVLLVIWVAATAAAAAASASPSCALSPPPSSSLPRRVQRGGGFSAGDGRRSLGFERGNLLREEALSVNLTILNTTILSGSTELIAPNTIVPVPPAGERHVWEMALSPRDGSLFFLMSGRIYKLPVNVGPVRANATSIAGPWNYTSTETVPNGMAMEDPDLAGSGFPQSGSSNSSRGRILHVSDCSSLTLRAFAVNGAELFSGRYRDLFFPYLAGAPEGSFEGLCFQSLAIDNARSVLYASSSYAIYRLNLTSDTLSYPVIGPETWIGPPFAPDVVQFRDSEEPSAVRFYWPFISSHAISEDGELIYVADMFNHRIRRIRAATGAVDTIAGNGSSSSEDGPALNVTFNSPVGLALTRDGCNLFVAEPPGLDAGPTGGNESVLPAEGYVGRLRLIQLNSGGDALAVTTVASLSSPSPNDSVISSLALSPNGTLLYLGLGNMQIMELDVKTEALSSCPAPSPGNGSPSHSPVTLAIIVTVTVALTLLVGTLILILWRRGRQWVRLPGELVRPSCVLKQYSWEELAKACDGFSPSRLVGKGGAAEVYRGELADGQKVAIKIMKGAQFSKSRFRQFQAELDVLATLRHMHLCIIIGYGAHQSKSFIVYPFVEGGTLYDCLQGAPPESNPGDVDGNGKRGPFLSWNMRISIARQVAKALRYLHEEVDPPVIHRDVKSKNVLLEYGGDHDSVKVRAYLSDFGLAKLGQSAFSSSTPPLLAGAQPTGNVTNIGLVTLDTIEYSVTQSGDTIQTVNVAGTMGYMAPEYTRSCWLTYKNDVYAFGVILLELITGRKAFGRMDILPGQQQDARDETKGLPETLTYWAKRTLRSLECLSASDEEEGSRAYTGAGVVTMAPLRSKASMKRAYSTKMNGVQELADPQVASIGGFDWGAMAAVLKLAMECVRTDPKRRPKMGEVLERLNRIQDGG